MVDEVGELPSLLVDNFSQEKEGKIYFNRIPPLVAEISPEGRQRGIWVGGSEHQVGKAEVVKEGEVVKDFKNSLELCQRNFERYPEERGDYAVSFPAFCENVRFIGHREFGEAVEAIADHWITLAKTNYVFVYIARQRSERWLAVQVFKKIEEKLTALPEGEREEIMKKIKFSIVVGEIGRDIISKKIDNWRVVGLDDVRVSGARSDGIASDIINYLEKKGFYLRQIVERIELNLIAAREDNPCEVNGFYIPIFSHFIVPRYENAPFGYCSFTGWWRTIDYGFGEYLRELFMRVKNISKYKENLEGPVLPMIARIQAPYNTDNKDRYLDPRLQQDWVRIKEKWELPTISS